MGGAPGIEGVELNGDDAAVAGDEEIDAVGCEMRLYALLDALVVLHKLRAYGGLVTCQLFKVAHAEVLGDGGQLAVAHEAPELPLRALHNVVVPPATICNVFPLRQTVTLVIAPML